MNERIFSVFRVEFGAVGVYPLYRVAVGGVIRAASDRRRRAVYAVGPARKLAKIEFVKVVYPRDILHAGAAGGVDLQSVLPRGCDEDVVHGVAVVKRDGDGGEHNAVGGDVIALHPSHGNVTANAQGNGARRVARVGGGGGVVVIWGAEAGQRDKKNEHQRDCDYKNAVFQLLFAAFFAAEADNETCYGGKQSYRGDHRGLYQPA